MGIETIKESLLVKQGEEFIDFIEESFVYPDETVSVRIYEIDNNVEKLKNLNVTEKAIVLGKLEKIIENFRAINFVLVLMTIITSLITDYGTVIELLGSKALEPSSNQILKVTTTIVATLYLVYLLTGLFQKSRRKMLIASYFKVVIEKI